MSYISMQKLLLLPIKRVRSTNDGKPKVYPGGQLQQVRHHAPICGPPRWPMSTGQRFIMGWGSLLVMMIIPYWALFQIPRWSARMNGRDDQNLDAVDEEEEAAKKAKKK